MRSSSWLGQILVVIVLLAGGAILWRTSEAEQRLAAAERDLVTLRYADAAAKARERAPDERRQGARCHGGVLAGRLPGRGAGC